MTLNPITTVAVWRNAVTGTGKGAPAAVNGLGAIWVQIDPDSAQQVVENGGASPEMTFDIYTLQGTPDIQRGDRLIAPDGSTFIVQGVQNYFGDHLEIEAAQILGT